MRNLWGVPGWGGVRKVPGGFPVHLHSVVVEGIGVEIGESCSLEGAHHLPDRFVDGSELNRCVEHLGGIGRGKDLAPGIPGGEEPDARGGWCDVADEGTGRSLRSGREGRAGKDQEEGCAAHAEE